METDRLVDGAPGGGGSNPSTPFAHFFTMALGYGVNMALVVVTLSYATSIHHSLLRATFTTGTFYATYSFSALVGGASACEQFGAHRVIIASLVGMLVYLIIFTLTAEAINTTTTPGYIVVLCGSVLGGASVGVGWSAQGVYFSTMALRHEKANGLGGTEAVDSFAGVFASLFLGAQCVFYLLQSLLIYIAELSETATFLLFTFAAAVVTGHTAYNLKPLDPLSLGDSSRDRRGGAEPNFSDNPQGGLDDDLNELIDTPSSSSSSSSASSPSWPSPGWFKRVQKTLWMAFGDRRGFFMLPLSIACKLLAC